MKEIHNNTDLLRVSAGLDLISCLGFCYLAQCGTFYISEYVTYSYRTPKHHIITCKDDAVLAAELVYAAQKKIK